MFSGAFLFCLAWKKYASFPALPPQMRSTCISCPTRTVCLGVLCWSAFAYVVIQFVPGLRGVRTGLIVAAAVFSHWVLDLVVHIPDLSLYDSVGKMGFGLWNHREAAFVLEIAVLFAGAAVLYRTMTHKGRFVGFVILLAAIQVVNIYFFPPPPSASAMAISAFVSYLVLTLLAWWVDRSVEQPTSKPMPRQGL